MGGKLKWHFENVSMSSLSNCMGRINVYFQAWNCWIQLQTDTACERNPDLWYFNSEGLNTTDDTK